MNNFEVKPDKYNKIDNYKLFDFDFDGDDTY